MWLLIAALAVPLVLLLGLRRRVSLLGRQFDLTPRRVNFGAHTARVGGRVYYQVLDAERALRAGDAIESRVQDALLTQLVGLLPQLVELSPHERNECLKADLRRQLRDDGILLTRLELAIRTNHTP